VKGNGGSVERRADDNTRTGLGGVLRRLWKADRHDDDDDEDKDGCSG
jgi:hypothetical protein